MGRSAGCSGPFSCVRRGVGVYVQIPTCRTAVRSEDRMPRIEAPPQTHQEQTLNHGIWKHGERHPVGAASVPALPEAETGHCGLKLILERAVVKPDPHCVKGILCDARIMGRCSRSSPLTCRTALDRK
mgnify:CR=1 FL=1